jgi:hypothetical protein
MGTLQHIGRISCGASIILSGFLLTPRVVWNATRREYIYILRITFVRWVDLPIQAMTWTHDLVTISLDDGDVGYEKSKVIPSDGLRII